MCDCECELGVGSWGGGGQQGWEGEVLEEITKEKNCLIDPRGKKCQAEKL